jgi:hypothetical protein
MRAFILFVGLALCACSSDESSDNPGSGGGGGSSCPATSAASLRDCVDKAKVTEDINFVAQPRSPGTPHHQAVQDLCKQRFEEAGMTVTVDDYGSGVNVIGVKEGGSKAAERVLISGHYDAVPDCAGADDNGTGTVAVLETARVLKNAKFARTLVLACWDEEEDGLIGAEAYAAKAKASGENIVVMASLEMIGFKTTAPNTQEVPTGFEVLFPDQYAALQTTNFVGDFLTIIPDTSARASADRVAFHGGEIGLPTVLLEITEALKKNPVIGDVRRSDHAAFWDADIPAMMLTDTSEFRNPNYHCYTTEDTVDTLDLDFLTDNTRAVVGATVDLCELE